MNESRHRNTVYLSLRTALVLVVFTLANYTAQAAETTHKSCTCRTLVFAFSGLRWDVEQITRLPSVDRMRSSGVHVKHKINAFQSESLPSFMTMSTGKYPNEHEIIGNNMRNEKGGKFDLSSTSPDWYKNVDPIWLRNQKENGTSALCYWPGHDIKGMEPDHTCDEVGLSDPFKELMENSEISKKVMSFQDRLDKVKNWLSPTDSVNSSTQTTIPHVKPTFIGAYFEEPYKSMLQYGIQSNETKQALKKIDSIIRQMLDFLKAKELTNKVNFVVTGESGVTEIKRHREIFLSDSIDKKIQNKYDIIKGAIMPVYPKTKTVEGELFKVWSSSDAVKNKQMRIYRKKDIPMNFHYKHETRSAPIVLVAQENWQIYPNRVDNSDKCLMGYDGKYESAHALFIAQGPSFKEDEVVPAIGNVDVFAILCRSLGITVGHHSGNNTIVEQLMRTPEKWYEKVVKKIVKKITATPSNFVAAIVIGVLLVFGLVFLTITAVYKACGCCRQPMRVKVPSPRKLMKKQRKKMMTKKDGAHLLSDKELSDSDFSDSDDFYIKEIR